MQTPMSPPPYPHSGFPLPGNTPQPHTGNQPISGYPAMQPFENASPPPYPQAPPYPNVGYPYMAYPSPAPVRRVPWWGQMIALVVPPPIAWALGFPLWGLLLWGTYGDSSTPPPNADQVAQWLTATYIAVGVLWGLGVHAIVVRKPWVFLAGFVINIGLIGGLVWAYVNLY